MLKKYIKDFLEYLEIERNCSKLTQRNYKHYLYRFLEWTEKNLKKFKIENLTINNVTKYRLYLSRLQSGNRGNLSKATQAYHIIALRSFLKYLAKKDISTLTAEKIELPKTDSRSLKFLNAEQMERLLNGPGISKEADLRDKVILEVLFSTGLRVSELVKLNKDEVDLKRQEFGVIGKGGRPRVVFLSDRAGEWIKRYIEQRTDDFKPLLIRYRGKIDHEDKGEKMRLTPRSVQRIVEKYVRKAKLPIKITPHGIRHSFSTDLLIAGADIRAVQEMLGHKNIATTQIYTHVTNKQLKKIHGKHHWGNR